MATNFPGSADSFTNPTSGSSLNSPSHAGQHADINDAMEAVQAKLGVGSGTIGTYTDISSSQTFSGFSKGNGTIISRYCKVNDFVHFWGSAVLGSTSSLTGPLDVALPFLAVGNTLASNSSCSAWDASASRLYWATALHIGTSVIRLVAHNSTGTYAYNSDIGTNVPFTWATGDIFIWNHFYEAS